MHHNETLLSAIVIVGSSRRRAQAVVDALSSQTRIDSIEIIIVDLTPDSTPSLHVPHDRRNTYVRVPDVPWGQARVEGVRWAKAPIVAFIEDHCIPQANWAEKLIEAHKSPWAAVGYAFTNGSPEICKHQASLLADYGLWAHPVRSGRADLIPGNNVSYKRDLLLSFGDQLETLLAIDFNLHEALGRRGLLMFIESQALAAHQNYRKILDLFRANHVYARLMGSNRARAQSWGITRRIIFALAAPVGVPPLRLARLLRSLRGRRPLWSTFVTGFPIIYMTYLSAALGESRGYLFGQGSAGRDLIRWELEVERIAEK